MIALLHYAYIKSMRDRMLPILLLSAPVFAAATLIGAAVAARQLRYPVPNVLNPEPALPDMYAFTFATIVGFWTFRSEMATQAIRSFVMARRPITVVIALVAFATISGMSIWITATITLAALTAELPPNLAWSLYKMAADSFAAAAFGALMVMISAQPSMLVWTVSGPVAIGFLSVFDAQKGDLDFDRANTPTYMMFKVLASIVCMALTVFLLRRRCAT